MKAKDYTDEELRHLFVVDPETAISALFRRHYEYLCKLIFRLIPDADVAEDLVQEVFYELWKKRKKLTITTSFKAYLRRVALNKTLNQIRDEKLNLAGEGEPGYQLANTEEPGGELEIKELEVLIDKTIDNLPDRCRMVFVLSRFENMSYKQIAQHMNISIKTVENQMSKALSTLRKAVSDYQSG